MAIVKVGIIDDGYPGMGKGILDFQDITHFIQEEDWGSHDTLRELNISLVKKSLFWKKHISLKGYRHPEFFLQEKEYNPQFLIYDWEYNLPNPEDKLTEDYLIDILKRTSANILIYSAWGKYDLIPEIIESPKFNEYRNRVRLLSKIDDKSDLEITKTIEDEFEKGEKVNWENLEIEIKPSKYLIDSRDFWKIKSLIGTPFLINYVNNESKVLNEDSIEKLFEESHIRFFMDKRKNILSSSESELLETGFGKLIELPPLEALRLFGIDKLEEAKEKGYTEIN